MMGEQFIEAWLKVPRKLAGECSGSEILDNPSEFNENSVFFQFFCYFMAFNHLYLNGFEGKCGQRHYLKATRKRMGSDVKHHDDREIMMDFMDRALKVLASEGHRFEMLDDDRMKSPVADVRTRCEHQYIADIEKEICSVKDNGERERLEIIKCFLRIYQVRCNLFHGGKSTEPSDRKVVAAATELLERFLWSCLKDSRGRLF